jgi:hypothetical protein
MSDELIKMLQQYKETFNENYPLMQVCETQEESIQNIKKCIADNKPLKMNIEKNILY